MIFGVKGGLLIKRKFDISEFQVMWDRVYVIVEKDSGNQHSPSHTIKRKLRICLDPRDLNEA